MPENEQKHARISAFGSESVTINSLTKGEIKKMEGVVRGHAWVTGDEKGRLKFVDTREKLPSPEKDDEMLPFWRKPKSDEIAQLEFQDLGKEDWKHSSPSIFIQHLRGYNYTSEGYRHTASQLEGYGFSCMRSKRGDDGRYWEIWFLPSLFLAEGALQETIAMETENDAKFNKAINFLCANVSFGSLDVSVQRAAMVFD